MADLTLAQRFGTDAVIIPDESGTQLIINLDNLSDTANGGDFTNGLGLDTSGITAENADEYASKILWALIGLSQQNQAENNNDETVGVYITNEGRRDVARNRVAQRGFRLVATAYKNDTEGLNLDPDEVGA